MSGEQIRGPLMIRLEFTSDVIPPRSPKGPRNQVAYLFQLSRDGKPLPHPTLCHIPLWDNQQPMAAGLYSLAPQAIYVDRRLNVSVDPKQAVPVASASGGSK